MQDPISYAHLANLSYIDELYEKYLSDPSGVESSWRYFFEGMQFSSSGRSFAKVGDSGELKVYLLIEAYRKYGHLMARCNPIATEAPAEPRELGLQAAGFKPEDLSKVFSTCGLLAEKEAPLSKIIEALKDTYCATIGIEYVGLGAPELERWVQSKVEPCFPLSISKEEKISILQSLNRAELFENFIHMKYVGQKRFSLEGGETLIPMLASLIDRGAELGIEEAVVGMAHRGRLNVLANILNKSYANIFHEFEDFYVPDLTEGTGDVKYHKGFHGSLKAANGKQIEVILAANPSHLDSVDPVVEGQTRAKQELRGAGGEKTIVPILIHGDASISGQGVVYETLQMSRLHGYATGGTIHIIVNNQIGFTTLPSESRSTLYCTAIAQAFSSPVFHVNAEDPEGCVKVARLAIEARQKFGCDVFIDLNCYRKYGHNEGDEPFFTQPEQYKLIKSKKSIREIFRDKLVQDGTLEAQVASRMEEEFKSGLHKALEAVSSLQNEPKSSKQSGKIVAFTESTMRPVARETLYSLAKKFCTLPENFAVHPKVQKLFQERLSMLSDAAVKKIDWGMAEQMAFASLLNDAIHIRLSGQDSQRGTFSQRHAAIVDQMNSQKYFPLSHLSDNQAPFRVYNSQLSEYAVLGFDLGYSLAYPNSLTIWEAQYGDFANGAQIVIDQYLSSSEQKWSLRANIVLMLPHGYEGQGPEHSSARMERYLQLSAEGNMIVANCSTPVQLFHLLRRQAFLVHRRPLVLFTPKALLRHPSCVSAFEEFYEGKFCEVLDDISPAVSPEKLLFCTGKIYYDLHAEREKRKTSNMAIVRIEQLYPFPETAVRMMLEKYGAKQIFWVQEEHSNMGAWDYVRPLLQEVLGRDTCLRYIGRTRSASAAAGSHALHKKQYDAIIDEVFR